ncbi:MAG TPA: hypothetical protein VK137_17745 [Planctomycetaceae bacterium]|nr:hypothetical protein [Planctomycetaceae bacterium]
MSNSTPISSAASPQSLAERVDKLSRQISQHEVAMNRSARTIGTVGIIALVLLSVYFFIGYRMINELLQPKQLVPLGAEMLQKKLPEARELLVQKVSDTSPAWAAELSVQARNAIPTLRGKLENYVMEQTDVLLGQATSLTEEQFRQTLQQNHELLDKGFRELAASDKLSDESLEALVAALEQQLQTDMKTQAEIVLETVRHLGGRVQRLQVGGSTDEEEKIERRVLMLARRLQLMEADPRPIEKNAEKAKATATSNKPDETTSDKTDPEAKEDKPADDKEAEAASEKKAD